MCAPSAPRMRKGASDWGKCLRDAQSTALAAEIASSTSWLKLWDMALDHGHQGTVSLQALFRELTRPAFGSKPCHRLIIFMNLTSTTSSPPIVRLGSALPPLFVNWLMETGMYSCLPNSVCTQSNLYTHFLYFYFLCLFWLPLFIIIIILCNRACIITRMRKGASCARIIMANNKELMI